MSTKHIRLSVLDQSPIRKQATAVQAVQETVELAKFTEQLGYTRFWVSEHHNTGILAGSAPEVLLANLAAHTTCIRLGSGGVMLPNHSALKVAENFRMLEALAPGRIDLGMGRAPGTDRITASILNPSNQFREQEFIEQLTDLQNYLHDTANIDNPIQRNIRAIPQVETVPAQWLLSSSGQSGLFAAHFGMGFSFAHFINPVGGPQAVQMYRDRFQPSNDLQSPEANMAIFVFCSEDVEKVMQYKAVMDARFLQFEKGIITPLSYDDVKDVVYTDAEQDRIRYNRQRVVAGNPEMVRSRLTQLSESYKVDEIIIVTICEDFNDRLRSYELLAQLFDLPQRD